LSFVYLGSPYSHPDQRVIDWRHEQTQAATAYFMLHGHVIFSPICHTHRLPVGQKHYLDFTFWMAQDLPILRQADELWVLMLPGWRESRGLSREIEEAQALGVPIVYKPWTPTKDEPVPESVLTEAERLINGERQASYGHPLDDYDCVAAIWRALIRRRYWVDIPISADFACLMMAGGVKVSREAGLHKRDNLVDGAGYLGCAQKCLDEKERRQKSGGCAQKGNTQIG
jgi:hypothetical protein